MTARSRSARLCAVNLSSSVGYFTKKASQQRRRVMLVVSVELLSSPGPVKAPRSTASRPRSFRVEADAEIFARLKRSAAFALPTFYFVLTPPKRGSVVVRLTFLKEVGEAAPYDPRVMDHPSFCVG